MKRYIWLFLVIISFCWITSGLSQFGNDPFQKSDTTGTVATQYDLTTGLALKLNKTAFDDSLAAHSEVLVESDTTSLLSTSYDLTVGLATKLNLTAFDDSLAANNVVVKGDSAALFATQYDLTTGLALQLQRAAFDDSIRSTFRKVVYVRPGESIQAAFTSLTGLSATQYGAVVLLPGTHTITTKLELRKYSVLLGYGRGISILYSAADIIMVESDSSCVLIGELTVQNGNAAHSYSLLNISVNYDAGTNILPFEVYNCEFTAVSSTASYGMLLIDGNSTYSNYLSSGSSITNIIIKQTNPAGENGVGLYIGNTGGVLYATTNYSLHIQNVVTERCFRGIQLESVQSSYISLRNNYCVALVSNSIALYAGYNTGVPALASTILVDGGRYDGVYTDIYISGQAGYVTTGRFEGSIAATITLGSNSTATYSGINGENITNDTIDDDALDFGTGTDQIDTDDLPAGSTNKYQDAEITNWIDDVVLAADGSITIPTTKHITVGTVQWDNSLNKIDGEQIADDTIDDDSIDLTDITLADFTDDVGYFKADGTVALTGNLSFTAAAPQITSANSLKIPAFEVIDTDTLNIGTGTDIVKIVIVGTHLGFVTAADDTFFTGAINDSTQF